MHPVRPFNASLYLSLALALLANGFAAGDLLWEIPVITAISLVMLGVAWWMEGRWELSLRNANVVGLFLGAFLGLWGIYQFVRPSTGLHDILPGSALVLPYLSPVLMILIPSKLLRPKHIGDYWTMQGLGLLAISIACAMAQDGEFVVIFILYAVTFVWSLRTFLLYRELGPEQSRTERFAGTRWDGLRPAALLALGIGLAALPLFWITPRTNEQWHLGINNRGATTGLGEGPIDLNHTGKLSVSGELAFSVRAEDTAGEPVTTLPGDLHWRVVHAQQYEGGRWKPNPFANMYIADKPAFPTNAADRAAAARSRLVSFGPETVYLHYTLASRRMPGLPVAAPVSWRIGQPAPVVTERQRLPSLLWQMRGDGAFVDPVASTQDPPVYIQSWVPPAAEGVSPAQRINVPETTFMTRFPNGLGRLKEYADQLIDRLVADQRLPREVLFELDPVTRARSPRFHEAIGRAFEQHLAASGEFQYTLELTIKDRRIDPVEDFLLNTKSGHCQRFAAALALLMRSQGIPTQMVLGYRGHENRGDGWYDIREDHAHAWVETLVPAPADGFVVDPVRPGLRPMRWVMLDPTPIVSMEEPGAMASLIDQTRQQWESLMKSLVFSYDREARERTAQQTREWLRDDGGFLILAGTAVGLIALWSALRMWRRRVANRLPPWPGIWRRVVLALRRLGRPEPGQTPMEFAGKAAESLAGSAATAGVADIPARVAAAYYAERFGGRVLDESERRELSEAVLRLETALTGGR